MGHHYVPQFLLRRWSTKGKFVAHYWHDQARKVIVNRKASVAAACQIANLNTFFGVPAMQRDLPETAYFTPLVDTPADLALKAMLKGGVRALKIGERMAWARFLVSFGVRTPETLREMGPQETLKAFDIVTAAATGPPADEAKVSTIIQALMPTLQRNFPLQAAIDISSDPQKLARVADMRWWLRRFDRKGLLIGDRPLLTYPRMSRPCGIPLDNPRCLIALPVAPDVIFFASPDPKTQTKTRGVSPARQICILNEETIYQSKCVFFPTDDLVDFVEPRLSGKVCGPVPRANHCP
jgi:hypothetical protein